MAENNSSSSTEYNPKNISPAKNALAALVALVFVLTAGYFAFNYFNDTGGISPEKEGETPVFTKVTEEGEEPEDIEQAEEKEETKGFFERAGEILTGASTSREESEVAGDASQNDNQVGEKADANSATSESGTSAQEQEETTVFGELWRANDYKQGDINKGDYEVQTGDTLWEIAEAAYGDGAQWLQVLQANSDSIGYLANGEHALIVPGQMLVLP